MEFCQASPSESEAVQVTLLHTGCKIAELFKRPGHIVRTIRKEPVKHNRKSSLYNNTLPLGTMYVYVDKPIATPCASKLTCSHRTSTHMHAQQKKKSSFI